MDGLVLLSVLQAAGSVDAASEQLRDLQEAAYVGMSLHTGPWSDDRGVLNSHHVTSPNKTKRDMVLRADTRTMLLAAS